MEELSRRALTVTDHTRIMQLVIAKAPTIDATRGTNPVTLLNRTATCVDDPKDQNLLRIAALEVADLLAAPELLSPEMPYWDEARVAVRKIVLCKGTITDLEAELHGLASQVSAPVAIGLKVADDILADGEQTVYNPEYWFEEQQIAPEPINSILEAMFNRGVEVLDAVGEIAGADAGGAVVGAAMGFIRGGQAGAAPGAVAGAIAGSVRGPARPAY